jgi:hypothetical protein
MNADHDPLEAELAGVRPVDLSPALRDRLSRQLEPGRPGRWARGRRLLLGIWLAAAASVLVALLTGRNQPTAPIPGPEIGPVPQVETVSRSRPTLFAYQQALNESDESFAALLDEHEPAYAVNATSFETVTVSSLFNDLLGDR